jgi:hypothetical protein
MQMWRAGRRIQDNRINTPGGRRGVEISQYLPVRGATATGLLRFVLFEELPRFFEGERVSVDDQLVFAGVIGDREDALDTMAVLAQGLDDEINVYHA